MTAIQPEDYALKGTVPLPIGNDAFLSIPIYLSQSLTDLNFGDVSSYYYFYASSKYELTTHNISALHPAWWQF